MTKKNLLFFISIFLIIVLFGALYKLYIPRVNAFGCFDDCFNYLGGYFINSGKRIFLDFFFNHQPGMAYLSAGIQNLLNTSSIPDLILRHRQIIFLISFASTMCLFLKFRYPILISAILYEPFKFYVFGDRFLAESIVGYLIIYMVGVCFYALKGRISKYDLYVVPFLAFLIIFFREPFIPAAIFLLATYLTLVKKVTKKIPIISLLIFIAPFSIFLTYDFAFYYLNLVTVNKLVIAPDASGITPLISLLTSIFYPVVLIATPGGFGFLRILFILYSICFLLLMLIYAKMEKNVLISLFILATLFLVNLRPVGANQTFYEAFHVAPWLLVFTFTMSLLTIEILKKSRRLGVISIALLALSAIFLLTNKSYFMYEKVDTSSEYFTNFSNIMDTGTTIRNLANSDDTLFVDGYDDLIIWEAKLPSAYKYTWYTSYMPKVELYEHERNTLLENSIPDFYYGKCLKVLAKEGSKASRSLYNNYIQINPAKDKSCILIRKDKASSISFEKREKIAGTKYKL